mmetsp:Transcript_23816/g.74080  ORF Transcript_23816/g.74080 Transcript_23816/m.74080 type:complete len:205 (+) Transcript_23816:190-804(+)
MSQRAKAHRRALRARARRVARRAARRPRRAAHLSRHRAHAPAPRAHAPILAATATTRSRLHLLKQKARPAWGERPRAKDSLARAEGGWLSPVTAGVKSALRRGDAHRCAARWECTSGVSGGVRPVPGDLLARPLGDSVVVNLVSPRRTEAGELRTAATAEATPFPRGCTPMVLKTACGCRSARTPRHRRALRRQVRTAWAVTSR